MTKKSEKIEKWSPENGPSGRVARINRIIKRLNWILVSILILICLISCAYFLELRISFGVFEKEKEIRSSGEHIRPADRNDKAHQLREATAAVPALRENIIGNRIRNMNPNNRKGTKIGIMARSPPLSAWSLSNTEVLPTLDNTESTTASEQTTAGKIDSSTNTPLTGYLPLNDTAELTTSDSRTVMPTGLGTAYTPEFSTILQSTQSTENPQTNSWSDYSTATSWETTFHLTTHSSSPETTTDTVQPTRARWDDDGTVMAIGYKMDYFLRNIIFIYNEKEEEGSRKMINLSVLRRLIYCVG